MSPADGPERIGDLLADAARRLGVEAELQLARAAASWAAIVAERVPEAASASRLVRFESGVLVVEVDEPIVGQELRLRSTELLEAFRAARGAGRRVELRIVVRRSG